jgi:hypothetical protein
MFQVRTFKQNLIWSSNMAAWAIVIVITALLSETALAVTR